MTDQLYFEDFAVGDSFASPSKTVGEESCDFAQDRPFDLVESKHAVPLRFL